MKTENKIRDKIDWIRKAILDKENSDTMMQIKLYAQLDSLLWVLKDENK